MITGSPLQIEVGGARLSSILRLLETAQMPHGGTLQNQSRHLFHVCAVTNTGSRIAPRKVKQDTVAQEAGCEGVPVPAAAHDGHGKGGSYLERLQKQLRSPKVGARRLTGREPPSIP